MRDVVDGCATVRDMDTATLARLEHQNMVATMSLLGTQVPGAVLKRADGVVLFATGMPVRLFNQVLVEAADASPDAIEDAVALARARGDHYVVNLRVGEDDRHLALVADLGLVPLSPEPWMPGMALFPLPAERSTALPPGHEIRAVTDTMGLRDHAETAAAGFGMPVEWLESVMTEEALGDPRATIYVGYTDGVPVTTGFGYRTERTIGVYNIATIESARRRGYGAAMTWRIIDDGRAGGCDVAILQASDMGFPVYEKMGFRTVVEYMGYVDPEPEPEA